MKMMSMKSFKPQFLTALFVCITTMSLLAQDKYEYAVVRYQQIGKSGSIFVSKGGADYTEIKIDKTEVNGDMNANPVLNYIKTMTAEGWEVVNGQMETQFANSLFFFMKKKTN
jgi:hypothetical protein